MFMGWGYFYSMIGQAAATLIGLMFVIVTLGSALGGDLRAKASEDAVPLFVTPTLVHFGAILFIALMALVPAGSGVAVLVCLTACGLAGLAYVVVIGVGIFTSRQSLMERSDVSARAAYVPVPAAAYLLIVVTCVLTLTGRPLSTLAVGAAVVILLAVGIRNAWGMALFVVRSGVGGGDRVVQKPQDAT
jgi:hypothetical protein